MDSRLPAISRRTHTLPLSRHSVEEVVWHIDVVILTNKIPSDLKSHVQANNFGAININCYKDPCVRINTVSLQ